MKEETMIKRLAKGQKSYVCIQKQKTIFYEEYLIEQFTKMRSKIKFQNLELEKLRMENTKIKNNIEWCKGCKEYDNENHCCHRFSHFINNVARENEEYYKDVIQQNKTLIKGLKEIIKRDRLFKWDYDNKDIKAIMEIINNV